MQFANQLIIFMKKYMSENLNTKSVYLRAFNEEDAILINKWRNDMELNSLTCGRFRYVGLELEKSWVHSKIMNNSKEEYFAICLSDGSDSMIGYTCIREIDQFNRSAHAAGIMIDPNYQDGTYMMDANLLVLEYSFIILGLNRLIGRCLKIHKDSRIMMEMLGYELEGIERESVYKNHEYMDVCRYSILYKDYLDLYNNGGYSTLSIAKRALKLKKQLKKQ